MVKAGWLPAVLCIIAIAAGCERAELCELPGTSASLEAGPLTRAEKPGGPILSQDGHMVLVPGGEFEMGSRLLPPECRPYCEDELPAHKVYLDPFWIDRTEVTVANYRVCVQEGVCNPPITSFGSNWEKPGREQYPVNCVSWFDADTYCTWAGKRLPTEAEWEKAARGTDGRIYPWGDDKPTCDLAVAIGKEGCEDIKGTPVTRSVGSKPLGASPYGVLDFIGNAREWVSDWYDEGYYGSSPARNPHGPDVGDEKVIRGLNIASPIFLRASARYRDHPAVRIHDGYGFRCARDASESTSVPGGAPAP